MAKDRAYDQTKTVLPAEVARGVYIENSPSIQALKLMHLLIATTAGQMADDKQHEIHLSTIRKTEGMRNHDRASLRALFMQLRAAVMVYDDTEMKSEIIGGFMDEIRLDYRDELSGDILVKWWFGRTFRRMAEESNHWAILDRQTVFHLTSKYSVLLFQHIASLASMNHLSSKEFTIPALRSVLGVEEDKLTRFADLNRRALAPAIAEINQLSRLTLTTTPIKRGRTVVGMIIDWEVKKDTTPVKRELTYSRLGRKARREGTVEEVVHPHKQEKPGFPGSGTIQFSEWHNLARDHVKRLPDGNIPDTDKLADAFRAWCRRKGVPLDKPNIENIFLGFCRKYKPSHEKGD